MNTSNDLYDIFIKKNFLKISLLLNCFLIINVSLFSQNNNKTETLISSFNTYTNLPREVIYTHLNKSTLIKGETLGFTVYAFDKNQKKLSNMTTNVYCIITDEKNAIVKSQLILIKNGIGSGTFDIDSEFQTGKHTFTAFTNWMKNFDEQNYYAQTINIIDPEVRVDSVNETNNVVDAQFLPEGGHLVADLENNIGVIIKDKNGFGVPNIEGNVIDSKNMVLTKFTTNSLGIGKFFLLTKSEEVYRARIVIDGNNLTYTIGAPKPQGINLSLKDLSTKIVISFKANSQTLPLIKDKNYSLSIHDGFELKIVPITFTEKEVLKVINYQDLSTGINIFTLFDENNTPLLERLFFKYDGINFIESSDIYSSKKEDSLLVTLPIKNINLDKTQNFSVSILPKNTKSYKHHQNSISALFLQPYLKTPVENASYYFTDIDRKKKYELDNLLMTQGWSSYEWTSVFNNPPKPIYNFETGISFKANINNTSNSKFILYPTSENEMQIFDVAENQNSFEATGLIVVGEEIVNFSEIKKNNSTEKSKLYLQFSPSKIPDFDKYSKSQPLKEDLIYTSLETQPFVQDAWSGIEQLDEVIILADKEADRKNQIEKTSFGDVDIFDDQKRNAYIDFASYIQSKGYIVNQNMGRLSIQNRVKTTFGPSSPVIYLDKMRLFDFDVLANYRMDIVDYIIIDKSGAGQGMQGSGGVIKIFTDYSIGNKNNNSSAIHQSIKAPLTYSAFKKFYTPKYSYVQSQFFEDYGCIDWIPKSSVDNSGNLQFKIYTRHVGDLNFYIEGTANDGSFISEIKTLIYQ